MAAFRRVFLCISLGIAGGFLLKAFPNWFVDPSLSTCPSTHKVQQRNSKLLCVAKLCRFSGTIIGDENRTQFFSSNFSGISGMSRQKSRDVPPKSLFSLGFKGHTEPFGPHPFTWKTPTPPEDIRTKKFGFGFLFLP